MTSDAKSPATNHVAIAPAAEPDPFAGGTDSEQAMQSLVGLLSAYTKVHNRLAELQHIGNIALEAAADSIGEEHTVLQGRATALEQKMEDMVRAHPEWMTESRSIATVSGTVKMTAATYLEPANEQLAVDLLRKLQPNTAEFYLRVSVSLNLEALAALDDEMLAQLHIRRVTRDSFSVTPGKANLGKRIKAKAKKATAQKEGADQ